MATLVRTDRARADVGQLRRLGGVALLVAILAVVGLVLASWMQFLLTVSLAESLAVLGVALLMRAGLVSFGQGLFYAAGGYAVAYGMRLLGLHEALLLLALGIVVSALVAAAVGPLICRYRQIFFAMISLAFSMVLYSVLLKFNGITGGSDGMQVPAATILGLHVADRVLPAAYYDLTIVCFGIALYAVSAYMASPLGYLARAVRDNEIRLEYLGASVQSVTYRTYVLAAALTGLGGGLTALAVGHVSPTLAYWTTSGEFIFAALLGGTSSALAPVVGTVVFESINSYASAYFPNIWEMVLGIVMLAIILLLPRGLWTLYEIAARRWSR
ncbi:MAG: branched-chain amino acid ABC transporter permease [bacterium]|nr:branched-chain amino acid ABC transporter permease [bacterium]